MISNITLLDIKQVTTDINTINACVSVRNMSADELALLERCIADRREVIARVGGVTHA